MMKVKHLLLLPALLAATVAVAAQGRRIPAGESFLEPGRKRLDALRISILKILQAHTHMLPLPDGLAKPVD